MKKLFLFCIACALLSSCANDEPMLAMIDEGAVAATTNHAMRSVDEAISLVEEQYGNILGERASRAALKIDRNKVIALGAKGASRSGAADTALYVVNFGDNSGFAVVTADKSLTPILAMAESGEINDIDDIEIPGLKAFMNASMMYATGGGTGITPPVIIPDLPEPPKMLVQVVDTITVNHSPCVEVAWGQKWPLGYFCPNKVAGCVVTAGVQALSYFEYPKDIRLSYPDRDRSTQSIYWPSIKEKVVSSSFYPYNINYVENLDEYLAIARFSREVGFQIGTIYHPESADPYRAASSSATMESLNAYLKTTRPEIEISSIYYEAPNVPKMTRWNIIIMRGAGSDTVSTGHEWIIDGFKSKTQHCKDYAIEGKVAYDDKGNPIIPSTLEPFMEYDVIIYSMSHINWGWNGNCNGFYDVGVYDTSKCKEPDGDRLWGLDKYCYELKYFTMFKL